MSPSWMTSSRFTRCRRRAAPAAVAGLIVSHAPAARLCDTRRQHDPDVKLDAPHTGGHGVTDMAVAGVATGCISAQLIGLPSEAHRYQLRRRRPCT